MVIGVRSCGSPGHRRPGHHLIREGEEGREEMEKWGQAKLTTLGASDCSDGDVRRCAEGGR